MTERVITLHPVWPLVVAVVAAGGFGAIAIKTGRSPITLSAAGAIASFLIGLTTSGRANACAVPNTPSVRTRLQLFAVVTTVVLVDLAALFCSMSRGRTNRSAPPMEPGSQLQPFQRREVAFSFITPVCRSFRHRANRGTAPLDHRKEAECANQ
jgi:hypothetical protein